MQTESIHCVVTSPPYWGLRDYGTATWEGGDAGCDHKGSAQQSQSSTLKGNGHGCDKPLSPQLQAMAVPYRNFCGKCGAKRIDNQIGLEATPDEFVARMVEVFREVKRVLRKDGTCWLNLGDSYASGEIGRKDKGITSDPNCGANEKWQATERRQMKLNTGLKQKDLIGIPWRVAFALQADGWWLRSDIIWHKPNPMPESVTDRCTKSHEYIFMLTKSSTYFYDATAIAEPAIYAGDVKTTNGNAGMDSGYDGHRTRDGFKRGVTVKETRNKRTVWSIPSMPFPDAHFATFPPELPELCIKAGCPKGGTVLDPFSGAGTTALVADRLQRNAIGIELNPEYAAMAQRRIDGDRGGLLDVMEAAAE